VKIVWFLPAIFAGTCFLLDWNNIMKLGYGDSEFCWFRQKDAIVYFVIIPIGISLAFNIVSFITTAVYLEKHRSQNMAARARRKKHRSILLINIKLSSLMGFNWLFGLLSVLVESNILDYLFVISTCLQGVFVSVAFVFKKETLAMYRGVIFSKRVNKTQRKSGNSIRNTSGEQSCSKL
jgi:hypothetical protein